VVLLLALAFMSFGGKFRDTEGLNVEMVGLYWHFVDIVWIAIFTIVYLLQV
jgi:heme/copper-type cytochrome/quinol oxidase subunit 3